MTAFLQTADGDLALSTGTTPGRLTLVDGLTEKAQKISALLEIFVGEWFIDQRVGVPYWTMILGVKNPDLEIIKRIFRRTILSVEGIVDVPVLDMSFDSSSRELSWSFEALDEAGSRITGGAGVPFVIVDVEEVG